MRARARSLVLLSGLAAALAGLVTWALLGVERPDEAARARHEREVRALPFRPADAVTLTLGTRGGAEVRLARDGQGWRLASGTLAGPGMVDGLLDRLSTLRVRATVPATPASLASRGLAPPSARVTVGLANGATLFLDLGDENPFDRTRYASRGGEILSVEGVPDAVLDPAPDRLLAPPPGG